MRDGGLKHSSDHSRRIAVGKPVIVSLDAGGTMTDSVIVDEAGNFTVGKALTIPQDESISFTESIIDSARFWNMDPKDVLSSVSTAIYSGTIMINTLLTRSGLKVGLIVTRGFEDSLLMERGLVWLGYSYADRLHTVTHIHNEPLVPRNRVKGVTERIDMMGTVVIPLYEHEVEAAVKELLDMDVEAIAVLLLYSYINPANEKKVSDIAGRIMEKRGRSIPVVLSSDTAPIMREYSRLNSVIIQAYAAEQCRAQLLRVEEKARQQGYKHNLLTMLSYGGLVGVRYPHLYETLISGPIGGMLGAKYVGATLGINDVVCCDMGGTSFDVGIIRHGLIPIQREPDISRFRLNLPMVMMDSIGAGTGTVIRVNLSTRRVEFGPESAGSSVGKCYMYQMTTISDCDVALGYLNPDYFLGGKVKLDKNKAYQACKELADAIGLDDVHWAASGILDLQSSTMRSHIYSMLLARGYTPSEYVMMIYGGGGPLHMWGFTEGIPFKAIMTFPFAAVFSAFGPATSDYSRRYQRSIVAAVPTGSDEKATMMKIVSQSAINNAWKELETKAVKQFEEEGIPKDKVKVKHLAYVRYQGQLDDHEVVSPIGKVATLEDLKKITDAFDDLYSRIYPKSAKYSEAGYQILEVGLQAYTELIKPKLVKRELGPKKPSGEAFKATREVYHRGKWIKFNTWEMDALKPGNVVVGPSIIEHPATTVVVPPGYETRFNEYNFIWYRSVKK